MNGSTFSRHNIFDFLLEKDFVYLAQSWLEEKGVDGSITLSEVTDWFHTYFPSHNSFKMLRELKSENNQFYEMKQITTEKEYQQVLEIIEELFDSLPNTPQGEELSRLVKLIEEFENKNYPIQ